MILMLQPCKPVSVILNISLILIFHFRARVISFPSVVDCARVHRCDTMRSNISEIATSHTLSDTDRWLAYCASEMGEALAPFG
jgi:hypothetical protein